MRDRIDKELRHAARRPFHGGDGTGRVEEVGEIGDVHPAWSSEFLAPDADALWRRFCAKPSCAYPPRPRKNLAQIKQQHGSLASLKSSERPARGQPMKSTLQAMDSKDSSDSATLLLRLPAVMKLTGLGRSTIYRLVADRRFPGPVRIASRAVAWRRSDLDSWSRSCPDVTH
jgi:prophage regulatory protein